MARFTLGIHLGHDRAVSIVKDGILHAHLAEERLDRVKHSPLFRVPFRSMNALFRQCRLKLSDFAAIGATYTRGDENAFLDELTAELEDYYQLPSPPLVSVGHHMAHALSSFHTADFQDALVFVADGSGDPVAGGKLEAESWFLASRGELHLAGRRLADHSDDIFDNPFLFVYSLMRQAERSLEMSFGHKYEQVTNLLGFGKHQEGTTMALASYGSALVDVKRYRFDALDYHVTRGTLLDELDSFRLSQHLGYKEFIRRYRKDLAATVQAFVEHSIVSILTVLRRESGCRRLCLGGGVFLNCAVNGRVLGSGLFDDIHVVPAAGDDGQSVGAAFLAYKVACGPATCSSQSLPFLGLEYSSRAIRSALGKSGLRSEVLTNSSLASQLSSCLARGQVVGLVRGRSELGPRALCHRSLLADPRSSIIRDTLNRVIKCREPFRPFAPVVTTEDQHIFFELEHSSRFMLFSTKVRKKYRRGLRGVTHVDGTARIQSISLLDDPFIHFLLKCFEKETGFPILLNTSFNRGGEPIVETPEDAIKSARAAGIGILVLERHLVFIPS
jgi:carbamoyltransferase